MIFFYGLVDRKTGYFVQFLAKMYVHNMLCILEEKKNDENVCLEFRDVFCDLLNEF